MTTFNFKGNIVKLSIDPDFGDSVILISNTILKRAYSGKIRSFTKPSTTKKNWEFSSMLLSEANALAALLQSSMGQQIEITDWNSTVFQAYITTDPITITEAARFKNSITLELELA